MKEAREALSTVAAMATAALDVHPWFGLGEDE
jgi:hypothetical protein